MARILIIDDSEITVSIMETVLKKSMHQVDSAGSMSEGLDLLASGPGCDLVLLDVMLPDGNGIQCIPKIKALPNPPEIIIITSRGDPDGASMAIQDGVWDYIEKGAPTDHLHLSISRALEYRALNSTQLRSQVFREGIVGESPQIKAVLDILAVAASSEANVLIMGETGTGKELFARALHKNSARSGGPFVVVDCTALPRDLADSILFGHIKGAFTSADRSHEGLIAKANGGTLFLDELGELPLSLQKSFLRVLQEGTYRQVGGNSELHSDFRVVAATNRNISDLVEQNAFRKDLLYRLNVFTLHIPALRARHGDIQALTRHFLTVFAAKYETEPKDVSKDFLDVLESSPWPGNVRELMNTLEKAVIQARYENKLFAKHLPTDLRQRFTRSRLNRPRQEARQNIPAAPSRLLPWKDVRESVVQAAAHEYFLNLMKAVHGDMKKASELSNMSVPNLYASLRKYKVSAKRLVYGE